MSAAPDKSPSKRPWLPWAVAALAAIGCLICTPAGTLIGYYFGGSRVVAVPGGGVVVLPPSETGKVSGVPRFQDLQDHLAKRGMDTRRGGGRFAGRLGMWFEPGKGGPLPAVDVAVYNELRAEVFARGGFFAELYESPERAKEQVKIVEDVQQKKALPWRHFVIHSSPETLAKLKKALD